MTVSDQSFLGMKNHQRLGLKTSESGRSLIEMLGTIAIITMLTIGGIAATQTGLAIFRTNTTQDEVEKIINNVYDLYSWQKDFARLDMSRICQNDVLERSCNASKTGWDNPFGGTTSVAKINNGENFQVIVTNVPRDVCKNFERGRDYGVVESVSISDGGCPIKLNLPRTLTFTAKYR